MPTSSADSSADPQGGLDASKAAELLGLLAKTSAARYAPKGSARDKLIADSASLRELFARVVAGVPRVRLYLGLFQVKPAFLESKTLPVPSTPEQAEAAIQTAQEIARDLALQSATPQELGQAARQSIGQYACQFSGKLIHSQSQGASAMVPRKATSLPHLSARRLQQGGWQVPLDQSSQDSSARFGRIVEVLRGDPVVQEAGLPQPYVQAVRDALGHAQDDLQSASAHWVDHRLRQLLLPAKRRYLAVSPLGAGGLTQAFFLTSRALEAASSEQPDPSLAVPTSSHAAEPRIRFSRITLPGGQPQNITTLSQGLKEPLYFETPEASSLAQGAWKVVRQPVRVRVASEMLVRYARQVLAFGANPFGANDSLASRHVERSFLRPVVREAHQNILDAAQLVQGALYEGLLDAAELREDSLAQARKGPLNALDRAVFFGEFSSTYVQEMASQLERLLRLACEGVLKQRLAAQDPAESAQAPAVVPLSSASLARQARALRDLLQEVI
jgi:hypothetical protein